MVEVVGHVVEALALMMAIVESRFPLYPLVRFGIYAIALTILCRGPDIEVVVVCHKDIVMVYYMKVVVYNRDIVEEHKERLEQYGFGLTVYHLTIKHHPNCTLFFNV